MLEAVPFHIASHINIVEKLGIQLPILLAQVVNFAILLFLLQKFLYKPILKMLDERKRKAAQLVEDSKNLQVMEEQVEEDRKQILKKAREEAVGILAEARKQAKADSEQLIAKTQAELAQHRKKLEQEMDTRLQQLTEELSQKTVKISSQMLKKVLAQSLTDEDQHRLIKDSLAKLEKLHA